MSTIEASRTAVVRALEGERAPRYTSYPTAPVFSALVGAPEQETWLAELDPSDPVSVYVHVPFCERLCWFCACRTQGTTSLAALEHYVDALEHEIALIAERRPAGLAMRRLHWGGGTPTILPPDLIRRLARAIESVFDTADEFEFSVEIDPTLVDEDKIAALRAQGFSRASFGIQDFSTDVQTAIGRAQSLAQTRAAAQMVRDAGVPSINVDLVYGLPRQTPEKLHQTLDGVLSLDPDRVALFGYAHVPWMAKRQKLIKESELPDDAGRRALFSQAANRFASTGFASIGIDHFAKPEDELCQALGEGRLRRNFQGYTADDCSTLLGIGASSISRLPQGYLQNAPATPAYAEAVTGGRLPAARGHVLTDDDRVRARAIEMLMCKFVINFAQLEREFGPEAAASLKDDHARAFQKFGGCIELSDDRLTILPEARALTRLVAQVYDACGPEAGRYSRAS